MNEKWSLRCGLVVAVILTGVVSSVWADGGFDAEVLLSEAATTIHDNAVKAVSAQDLAAAIFKLEKAQALLSEATEKPPPPKKPVDKKPVDKKGAAKKKPANIDDEFDEKAEKKPADKRASRPLKEMLDEVNVYLFWTKRFSDAATRKALEKIHADNPAHKQAGKDTSKPKGKDSEKKAPQAQEGEQAFNESDLQVEARVAYLDAEKFGREHSSDDLVVSLCWFQMAVENLGSDYSFDAFSRAYEAQVRYVAKNGGPKEEQLIDTPEMNLVREGDAQVEQGKLDLALERYTQSFRLSDNEVAHRRLGRTLFVRAEQVKEELLQKMETLQSEFKSASDGAWEMVGPPKNQHKEFNPNAGPLVAARKKRADIMGQVNQNMFRFFNAQSEFEKVLKMIPDNRDYETAAFAVIAMAARSDQKNTALQAQQRFLKDYEPNNGPERMLRDYCQSSVEHMGGK